MLRWATPNDAETVVHLIRALAEFEGCLSEVKIDAAQLRRDGLGLGSGLSTGLGSTASWCRPALEVLLIGVDARSAMDKTTQQSGETDRTVDCAGFALFHETYSTWRGRCLHIDDLYVEAQFRGLGIGTMVLRTISALAEKRGCARVQWQSLHDNDAANGFYREKIGAKEQTQILDWRLADVALRDFVARGASRPGVSRGGLSEVSE
jgi:ribosomal protein S18 acetylase RimI-like enzyme